MKKTDTLPATLSALIQEYSIAEGIQMAEQQVRENPAKALCRHSLFQLLCVAGDWSRALHQLQLLRIPLYSITDWHRSPISDSHPFDQPGT